eukprot:TRINITY_DN4841_c2_g1_i1.p1 TRINITY_DN4841_c2_g1~~TRINITY_DN4841_c2_g1_i1.p1  ORF type:complete len:165 (+),score=48.71 TRINITY_DN4841_c2_g1_i1:45-539(+)
MIRNLICLTPKATTYLTGVPVLPNGKYILTHLYEKILNDLEQNNIPKDTFYRKTLDLSINRRLDILRTEEDVEVIEKKINDGQIETLIMDAEDELELIPKMAEWKLWENEDDEGIEVKWEFDNNEEKPEFIKYIDSTVDLYNQKKKEFFERKEAEEAEAAKKQN